MLPYKWDNIGNIQFKQLNLNTDLEDLDKLIRKEQFQMILILLPKHGRTKLGLSRGLDADECCELGKVAHKIKRL